MLDLAINIALFTISIIFSPKFYSFCSGGESVRNPNILTFSLFLWLIPFGLLGSFLLSLGANVYFLKSYLTNFIDLTFRIIVYCIWAIPIGFWIGRKLGHISFVKKKSIYINQKRILFLFIVSLLAGFYTIYNVNSVPLFKIFDKTSLNDLMVSRSTTKFNFAGLNFIKGIFFNKLSVFLALISYSLYLDRKIKRYRILFLSTLFWAIFSEFFYLEKSPVAFLILGIVIVKILKQRSFQIKYLIKNSLLIILIIGAFYLLIEGDLKILSIANRVFLVPLTGLIYSLYLFPSTYPFLNGASFPQWMISIFDMTHTRSAKLIMEYLNPVGVADGSAGVVNSIFAAEAYANFGWIGLIISPLIVGISIFYISRYSNRDFLGTFSEGAKAYLIITLPLFGGFIDFVWNVSWIILLILANIIGMNIKFSQRI